LWFVRLTQEVRGVWISGTAVYDNGKDDIMPKRFSAGEIIIDGDFLGSR
jgi:hypothetical protein